MKQKTQKPTRIQTLMKLWSKAGALCGLKMGSRLFTLTYSKCLLLMSDGTKPGISCMWKVGLELPTLPSYMPSRMTTAGGEVGGVLESAHLALLDALQDDRGRGPRRNLWYGRLALLLLLCLGADVTPLLGASPPLSPSLSFVCPAPLPTIEVIRLAEIS